MALKRERIILITLKQMKSTKSEALNDIVKIRRLNNSVSYLFKKIVSFFKITPLLKKFGGKSIGVNNKNLAAS
jgi:hypothetical protein